MFTPKSGFKLVAAPRMAGPWPDQSVGLLVPVDPAEGVRVQAPMLAGLFKAFAKLETADDYLHFANTHGRLGVPFREADTLRLSAELRDFLEHAEAVDDWRGHVHDMWKVTEMWQRLTRGGEVCLEQLPARLADGWIVNWFVDKDHAAEIRRSIPKAQPIRFASAAIDAVIGIVNRRLSEGATMRLSRRGSSPTELALTPAGPTLALQLWADCARWMAGEKLPRQCFRNGCNKLIEAESRRHRLFHSNTCRALHHQSMRTTAIKLSRSGVPSAEILSQLEPLGVSAARLNQWIKKTRLQSKGRGSNHRLSHGTPSRKNERLRVATARR